MNYVRFGGAADVDRRPALIVVDATDPELTYRRWQNRSTLLPYRSAVVRERSKEDRDEPLAVSGCELTLENCQRTLI